MSENKPLPLPYQHLLGKRDALAVLSETPLRLNELTRSLTPVQIDKKPSPGKWSLRETQAHLADCEIAWSWRLRLIYGADNPTLQAFDQDAWAARYDDYSYVQARNTWQALRAWNITFLTNLSLSERALPAVHPDYGTIRLYSVAAIAAGHDLHHLRTLATLVDGLDASPGSPGETAL